jgi:hypothetical protein
VSSTHTILEVRSGVQIFRSSLFGSSGGFEVEAIYPTCLKRTSNSESIYKLGILKARFLSFLVQENRVWND